MSWFQGTGGARPSKTMSWLTAVVGVCMVVCVAMFFVAPAVAGIAFVALWVTTAIGVIGYHVKNARSEEGVDHTRYNFQAESGGRSADFDGRLRDLERLRGTASSPRRSTAVNGPISWRRIGEPRYPE